MLHKVVVERILWLYFMGIASKSFYKTLKLWEIYDYIFTHISHHYFVHMYHIARILNFVLYENFNGFGDFSGINFSKLSFSKDYEIFESLNITFIRNFWLC